jgi:hypothetical protein
MQAGMSFEVFFHHDMEITEDRLTDQAPPRAGEKSVFTMVERRFRD